MERIRHKVFSVDEANQLLPYLDEAIGEIATLSRKIIDLRGEIEVLSAIELSGATSASADVRSLREKEQNAARLIERFRQVLEEVAAHGCILRDIDLGLVDFYAMAQGRIVCLCWRRGEPRIEHWHPLDQGF